MKINGSMKLNDSMKLNVRKLALAGMMTALGVSLSALGSSAVYCAIRLRFFSWGTRRPRYLHMCFRSWSALWEAALWRQRFWASSASLVHSAISKAWRKRAWICKEGVCHELRF